MAHPTELRSSELTLHFSLRSEARMLPAARVARARLRLPEGIDGSPFPSFASADPDSRVSRFLHVGVEEGSN